MPSPLKQNDLSKESLKPKNYSLICFVLTVILTMALVGLTDGNILEKSEVHSKEMNYLQEQMKNNETVQRLKEQEMMDNETIEKLTKKTKDQEEKLQITIGTTCGCQQWCKENMKTHYGVCGDGHTCICRQQPITKDGVGYGCTCESWCQKSGYKNGGICGDGYTCICLS